MKSKHIIARCIVILFIHFSRMLHAQNCGVQAIGISTNPEAPVNPECNGQFINVPSAVANKYLDWRSQGFANAFTNNPPLMPSPFFETNNGMLTYLWDDLGYPDAPDFNPADGWELIDHHISSTEQNLIYFILYNKYTSTLRVLAAAGQQIHDYVYVNVILEFANGTHNKSALLSGNDAKAQALDQETSITKTLSLSIYPNNNDMWFHADFPMAYDICTCQFASNLQVKFQFVTESMIALSGRGLASPQILYTAPYSSGSSWDYNFLSTFAANELGSTTWEPQKGVFIYKGFNGLVENYRQQSRFENRFRKPYMAYKAIKDVIETPDNLPLNDPTKYLALIKGLKMGYTGVGQPAAAFVDKLSVSVKAQLDNINTRYTYLGMTTVVRPETNITGLIASNVPIGVSASILNPGSKDLSSPTRNCDIATYPMYNEVLGRFALLETPKVIIENQNFKSSNSPNQCYQNPATVSGLASSRRYGFKIGEDLKYKFNPAANVNLAKTTIDAAIVLKVKSNDNAVGTISMLTESSCLRRNFTLVDYDTLNKQGTFITPFVPVSCLSQLAAIWGAAFDGSSSSTYPNIAIQEVDLRLIIGYEFNDPNVPRAVEVLTYPTSFSFPGFQITGADPGVYNVNSNTYQVQPLQLGNQDIPYRKSISATHYTQSQTIFAWAGIDITGNITCAPGVTVEIVAPEINLNGTVGDGITLRIGNFPYQCAPLPEWNGDITNYCNGIYKANKASKLGLITEPHNSGIASNSDIPFVASPNPFSDDIAFSYTLAEGDDITLSIYNALGEEISRLLDSENIAAGTNATHTWNASNLPAGLYFVTLQGKDFRKTIKVIKQ